MAIDESVASQFKQLLLQMSKGVGSAFSDIGKLSFATLIMEQKLLDKDKVLNGAGEINIKKLYQFSGNEEILQMTVADADLSDFLKHVKNQNVSYALINCKADNSHKIVYLGKNSDKIKSALTMFMAERKIKTEIPFSLFMQQSNKKLTVINDISGVDLELFRFYAKKEGLIYALTNKSRIVFNETDKEKAINALNAVGAALESSHGELIRKQIELRLEGRTAVNIAMSQAEKELYIVSSINPSNYIKVTPDDFTYYKNNKALNSLNREEPDFTKSIHKSVDGILEPVVLTKDEFESKNKSHFITLKTYPLPVDLSMIEIKKTDYYNKFKTQNITKKSKNLDTVIENAIKKKAKMKNKSINSKTLNNQTKTH